MRFNPTPARLGEVGGFGRIKIMSEIETSEKRPALERAKAAITFNSPNSVPKEKLTIIRKARGERSKLVNEKVDRNV